MQVRVKGICATHNCNEYFEYWSHLSLVSETDHDTFGSNTTTELKFEEPSYTDLPEGWTTTGGPHYYYNHCPKCFVADKKKK